MKYIFFLILMQTLALGQGFAQNLNEFIGDEGILYAETKQLNQFIRRFNNEEDLEGKRKYPGEPGYREKEDRIAYIRMLFDRQNQGITEDLKQEFITAVTDEGSEHFLAFQGGNWFAEVETEFEFKGEKKSVTLFLKIQKEPIGSKWVISHVFFEEFSKLFGADTSEMRFIHPMSHELEFMNLNKVFREMGELELYTQRGYKPDYVSLLFYELKLGNMHFKQVNAVKFHFFQIDQWYFEVSRFNREDKNRGWLISNMARVSEEEKKNLLSFIYYEAN
jgi:hypothetical protein